VEAKSPAEKGRWTELGGIRFGKKLKKRSVSWEKTWRNCERCSGGMGRRQIANVGKGKIEWGKVRSFSFKGQKKLTKK